MTEQHAQRTAGPWRRLSPWSVVFIFVRNVSRLVRENLPLLAGAGAGIALIERIGLREAAMGAAALLLLAALASVLYYRRFRFRVEDDVLRVQKGLLERTELKVRARNVQHLALEQPLHLRVFGLVRFKADTPGGLAAEVELPGIPMADAVRLRQLLGPTGAARAEPSASTVAPPAHETVYRISARGLTLHGLASSYIYAAVAAAAPFLQIIERRMLEILGDTALAQRIAALAERPLWLGAASVLSLFMLLAAASVAVAWLRFHGFTLIRHDGRFTQHSGLFSRQEQILSMAKLQSIEWVQTALGRLLGRSHLICRQVGGGPLPGRERVSETFVVPGLDRATAERLARAFCPGLNPTVRFEGVHRHYRRVLFLRSMLPALLILIVLAGLTGSAAWLAAIAVAPLPLWLVAHLRWRAVAWSATADHLQVRRGLLRRRTTMFAVRKVQGLRLSQSWFQRRRQLATLTLLLASGPVTLPFIREQEADRLINHVAHEVESAVFRRRQTAAEAPACS